jgi:hypothetical protein
MSEETADKPKLGWGGPRANQHGRPKLPNELRRVQLRTRVLPTTLHFLSKDKDGMGKAIDKIVERMRKRK